MSEIVQMTGIEISADNLCKQFVPRSGQSKCLGLIWIQTVLHPDGILKRIFQKSWFWKIADDKKSMKNYPECEEIKRLIYDYRDQTCFFMH